MNCIEVVGKQAALLRYNLNMALNTHTHNCSFNQTLNILKENERICEREKLAAVAAASTCLLTVYLHRERLCGKHVKRESRKMSAGKALYHTVCC